MILALRYVRLVRWVFLLAGVVLPEGAGAEVEALRLPATAYTHGCWLDGYHRMPHDGGQTRLAIETGAFAVCFNPADLTTVGCEVRPGVGYTASLAVPATRLGTLPAVPLEISCTVAGVVYRAWGSDAGVGTSGAARLWESGQLVQHDDFLTVRFRDNAGHDLGRYATLDVLAWPESLTLGVTFPAMPNDAATGRLRLALTAGDFRGEVQREIAFNAPSAAARSATVTMRVPTSPPHQTAVTVTYGRDQPMPVRTDSARDCQVAEAYRLKRTFPTGYVPLNDYDEFRIHLPDPGPATTWVRFLLDVHPTANPTGVCPVLCHGDGTPTGIPVQLSKNFHLRDVGDYVMAYALLPVPPGGATYLLRLVYGFYGTLPAASDAQLCLVGYRGKGFGRWDMLSIGCWGETFCFDPDMSLVDCAITDVRLLMTRVGAHGRPWWWTNAGWGGDWLGLQTPQGRKVPLVDVRSAYLSHGPCLTDVIHAGSYGIDHQATVEVRTSTLRTDDYARTFQHLRATFSTHVPTEGVWLHKMGGRANHTITPQVVIGSIDGLQQDLQLPATAVPGAELMPATESVGGAPWWIALPGGSFTDDDAHRGQGWRAVAIRSYRLCAGGRTWDRPTICVRAGEQRAAGVRADILLVPPPGLAAFAPGDTVEMDLTWLTVPRDADSYYGPNQAFREHLAAYPSSWRTAWREVQGNDLKITVMGGTVLRRYPVEIRADAGAAQIALDLEGGLGFIPVTIMELPRPDGWQMFQQVGDRWQALDQSRHGHDFWQVVQGARGWNVTWNLPGDTAGPVRWVVRQR